MSKSLCRMQVTTPAGGKMKVWDFQKVALEYMTPVEVVMKFGKTPRPPSAREKKLNLQEKIRQQNEYHQRYLNSVQKHSSRKDDSECSDSYAAFIRKKKFESREGR